VKARAYVHIQALSCIVGSKYCLDGRDEQRAYTVDYRGIFKGRAMAVVRPGTVHEVSAVMAYCSKQGIAVVPQGGNTSLLGGAVPDESGESVVVVLSRLNQVRSIDPENGSATVEAGMTLHAVRELATSVGMLFPLRIGSEGSCQIGGNISTNAGGTAVLRYGNMRDLVLGIEAVLPDGRIWNGLRKLRKDNTGYDLKQLFIGSEGTLGIVTAAVLKLFPMPKSAATAFVALPSADAALKLLGVMRQRLGHSVTTFELMSDEALDLVSSHLNGERLPVDHRGRWCVLAEASSGDSQSELDSALEEALSHGMEQGWVLDASVASNTAQALQFWRLREEISDAQTRTGGSIRCDISVPLSDIPRFIALASDAVRRIAPDSRMVVYGHMGDGNVHFNPLRPSSAGSAEYLGQYETSVTQAVDDIATGLEGSISAEHGVGVAKRDEIFARKSEVECWMAQRVKQALDPYNLLNPGKVLPFTPQQPLASVAAI
jgi:FAD/FMN-containing dehydrogenase